MNKDSKNQVSKDRNDKSNIVTEIIRQLGVPEHIKGYHYLKEAILASIEHKHLIDNVTKNALPDSCK